LLLNQPESVSHPLKRATGLPLLAESTAL